MNTLEQRLEILERDYRRSRKANRILATAVVALICLAAAPGDERDQSETRPQPQQSNSPKDSPARSEPAQAADRLRTVEADQFVLLDREGRSRARLAVAESGPELCMYDDAGQKRVEIGHADGASGLRFFDGDGTAIVSLQLPRDASEAQLEIQSPQGRSATSASGYAVFDAAEQGRLRFSLINGNYPMLGISQSGQTGPASIEMTASAESRSMKLHDDRGFPLFTLFAAEDGRTSLELKHPDRERTLQISNGSQEAGGPRIALFAPVEEGNKGETLARLQLGLDRDRAGYLRLVGPDGKTQFAAPPQ